VIVVTKTGKHRRLAPNGDHFKRNSASCPVEKRKFRAETGGLAPLRFKFIIKSDRHWASAVPLKTESLRLACTDRSRILIGSCFFVTLSPLTGQQTANSRQNMTYGPKNSDKSLRVPDLIARLVEGK
jgi:hypothetical protein